MLMKGDGLGFKSPIQEVEKFLKQLRNVLDAPTFDVDCDFILIQKRKSPEQTQFSTPNTLIDLDFDAEDVLETLKNLTVADYSETLSDQKDNQPPLLFVFGKEIKGTTVYIKVKIKRMQQDCVLVVSFHYAQYPMNHPHA